MVLLVLAGTLQPVVMKKDLPAGFKGGMLGPPGNSATETRPWDSPAPASAPKALPTKQTIRLTTNVPAGFKGLLGPGAVLPGATSKPSSSLPSPGADDLEKVLLQAPVLSSQVDSIMSPPVSKHDVATAADVSDMFLTGRSDLRNTLMASVKDVASQAHSTGEAEAMMGLMSPIGLESGGQDEPALSKDDVMNKLMQLEKQIPTELVSPSGQHLSLTSFPQLVAQASIAKGTNGAVKNVPQGLEKIGKEFGTTISSMAAHVGRLFGPSSAYNGPCQCRACMNVVHRLRGVLYENTFHYGVQEIDQELDDRFCYGERWMYRSTCYNLIGKYREMLKILVWLGTKEFDVCAFLFQCYPTSKVTSAPVAA